ncbi:unnamed protein product [Cyprideis torosa]|uniref:Uncharacterized protein n=1 Tax=Cyprideis torosa TaxID=163714 RepID=A0A7R8W3Q3_9CRUS|nr:unnamed protein product [Cyprideis torosa]CAG0883251.1 unnamed protein product [Cyprideis torosa]
MMRRFTCEMYGQKTKPGEVAASADEPDPEVEEDEDEIFNAGDGDLSDYAADELDLTKDLYSLEHYLEKPEEMIEQTFNVVRGGKLSAMLPPILKDIPIEDLKELCLTELKKLSVDDVKGILEGKHFSRDSDGGSDQSGGEGGPTKSGPPQVKKEDSPEPEFGKGFKRVEKKAITIKTLCLPNDDELMGTTPSSPPKQETDKGEGGAIKMDAIEKDLDGRTLMELLELEMRAKALRQLIESKDSDEEAGAGQEKSTAKKRFR